jgi:hypothetical protein
MSLTWLDTEGGPFIVVPRTTLPHWSGTEGDYDRACEVTDFVGVADQPAGQRGFTRREHIDHPVVFDAGQNGGVDLAAADLEVVHAQHPRSTEPRIGQCHDLA